MFQGEPETRGMSMAGYDVITPGTHEFDYGAAVYGHALDFADFDGVSANLEITDPAVSQRMLPYVIKDVAGVRIGILGLTAPDFALFCNPTGGGVQVNPDIIAIARGLLGQIQRDGCDRVVALTHMGLSWVRE